MRGAYAVWRWGAGGLGESFSTDVQSFTIDVPVAVGVLEADVAAPDDSAVFVVEIRGEINL